MVFLGSDGRKLGKDANKWLGFLELVKTNENGVP